MTVIAIGTLAGIAFGYLAHRRKTRRLSERIRRL